jgi:hypothetical protein
MNKGLIIIGALVVVGGGLGYYLYSESEKKKKASTPTVTAPIPTAQNTSIATNALPTQSFVPNSTAPASRKAQPIKVADALKNFKYSFEKETVSFVLNGVPVSYSSIFARDSEHKTWKVPQFDIKFDRWNSPKDAVFKIIITSIPEFYQTVISFRYDGGVDSEESRIMDYRLQEGNWIEVTNIRLDEYNSWALQSQNDEIKFESALSGLGRYRNQLGSLL